MPTIERRGEYWRVKIRRKGYPDATRSFDTKSTAERWARDVEREMDAGTYQDRRKAESTTLRELIERYVEEVTPQKRGAEPERLRLLVLAKRKFAGLKISAVTSTVMGTYRDERLQEVSASTVNKELNHLSHIIEIARQEWGIALPNNPVSLVRRPASNDARNRRLNPGEEERLLSAIDEGRNEYLKPIVLLAIETAMRQGEILGLQWENVDLVKRVAFLPLTKNGDSRGVPLSKKAVAILKALPAPHRGAVFRGVTREAVKQSFDRARIRAGLPDLRFHDLRHEATTRFFEKGLDMISVATITGHKSLQMLKRYAHLAAVDSFSKLGHLEGVFTLKTGPR